MPDLLRSPFAPAFEHFVSEVREHCLICSPYITAGPIQRLVSSIEARRLAQSIRIQIITDVSANNIVQGSTDISALLFLAGRVPQVEFTYLPRIHAKAYVCDDRFAIVGSANFTEGGSSHNLEYGARFQEPAAVAQISQDIQNYAALGAPLSPPQLARLQTRVETLRDAVAEEQRSVSRQLRAFSAEFRREMEDDLIRVRVERKTVNAIFSETILFLLADSGLSTEELQQRLRDVHPDLCDDTSDRIIDGRHFGKLWKHQMRNAQVTLKKKGDIDLDRSTRRWRRLR